MHPYFIILMVIAVSLAIAVTQLARSARRNGEQGETMDDLRSRIRTLEAIITDQERKLRRDFDGLA